MTILSDNNWRVGYPTETPVTGRVAIVQSSGDQIKVLQGDILVAPQTNVGYAAAMLAAAAIITADNGEYVHAAGFAREHKIPCLFAATGVLERLNDGDLVTVDTQAKTITVAPRAD